MVDKREQIFGNLFRLSNKLQATVDKLLAPYDISTKQWLLTALLQKSFGRPVSLGELADAMGCTYQNVKQTAQKLQKKGYIRMEKDEKDRRVTLVKLTQKHYMFWNKKEEEGNNLINKLFEDFSQQEIDIMHEKINRLIQRLDSENFPTDSKKNS